MTAGREVATRERPFAQQRTQRLVVLQLANVALDFRSLVPGDHRNVTGKVLKIQFGKVVGVVVMLLRSKRPASHRRELPETIRQRDEKEPEWNQQQPPGGGLLEEASERHEVIIEEQLAKFEMACERRGLDETKGAIGRGR